MRGGGLRREKIEKPKPFRRRLGNGTTRSVMISEYDFLAHGVADCDGATSERRRAIHFPIFRAAGIKRLRSRDS